MKRTTFLLMLPLLILARASWSQETAAGKAAIVEVRKIWDRAPHNAFTDLVRFRDRWLCVFREGQGHVSPDGSIRVIASSDGRDWSSSALLTLAGRRPSRSQDHANSRRAAHDRRRGGPGSPAERRGQAPIHGLVLARRPGLGRGSCRRRRRCLALARGLARRPGLRRRLRHDRSQQVRQPVPQPRRHLVRSPGPAASTSPDIPTRAGWSSWTMARACACSAATRARAPACWGRPARLTPSGPGATSACRSAARR